MYFSLLLPPSITPPPPPPPAPPRVSQIILSYHRGDKQYGSAEFSAELAGLRRIGLELGGCIAKDQHFESCVLFSAQHCQYDDLPQAMATGSSSSGGGAPAGTAP